MLHQFLDLPELKDRIIGFPKIKNEILDLVEDASAVLPTGLVKVSNEVLDLAENALRVVVGIVKKVISHTFRTDKLTTKQSRTDQATNKKTRSKTKSTGKSRI